MRLLLATAGIFGVTSYSVTQRTREIGIRLALGAQRFDVFRLVVGQGMRFVGVGLVPGFLVVFALTRLLEHLLFGIGATDPLTIVMVSLVLALVALIACWLPARRASAFIRWWPCGKINDSCDSSGIFATLRECWPSNPALPPSPPDSRARYRA